MTQHKSPERLDFEALRRAVELCDPETLLGFYADGAQLRIVNGDTAVSAGQTVTATARPARLEATAVGTSEFSAPKTVA